MIYEREKIQMKYNLKIIWNENDLKSECSVPIQDRPDSLSQFPAAGVYSELQIPGKIKC